MLAFLFICSFAIAETYTKTKDGAKLVISDVVPVVKELLPEEISADILVLQDEIKKHEATIVAKKNKIAYLKALASQAKALNVTNASKAEVEEEPVGK